MTLNLQEEEKKQQISKKQIFEDEIKKDFKEKNSLIIKSSYKNYSYTPCMYIRSNKNIFAFNWKANNVNLLDNDLKVTHTSAFSNYYSSSVEMGDKVLYYMYDGETEGLALVNSHNL